MWVKAATPVKERSLKAAGLLAEAAPIIKSQFAALLEEIDATVDSPAFKGARDGILKMDLAIKELSEASQAMMTPTAKDPEGTKLYDPFGNILKDLHSIRARLDEFLAAPNFILERMETGKTYQVEHPSYPKLYPSTMTEPERTREDFNKQRTQDLELIDTQLQSIIQEVKDVKVYPQSQEVETPSEAQFNVPRKPVHERGIKFSPEGDMVGIDYDRGAMDLILDALSEVQEEPDSGLGVKAPGMAGIKTDYGKEQFEKLKRWRGIEEERRTRKFPTPTHTPPSYKLLTPEQVEYEKGQVTKEREEIKQRKPGETPTRTRPS